MKHVKSFTLVFGMSWFNRLNPWDALSVLLSVYRKDTAQKLIHGMFQGQTLQMTQFAFSVNVKCVLFVCQNELRSGLTRQKVDLNFIIKLVEWVCNSSLLQTRMIVLTLLIAVIVNYFVLSWNTWVR